MHIRFAEADEAFIKASVEEGLYTSETELVRDAVRRLREKQNSRLYHAVQKGIDDIEAGRTVPLTPELMESIMQRAKEKSETGESYHSDDAIPDFE